MELRIYPTQDQEFVDIASDVLRLYPEAKANSPDGSVQLKIVFTFDHNGNLDKDLMVMAHKFDYEEGNNTFEIINLNNFIK